MKKTKINEAASLLAKKRWKGMTEAEISAHQSKIASIPRTAKRCFCVEESMWTAASRSRQEWQFSI